MYKAFIINKHNILNNNNNNYASWALNRDNIKTAPCHDDWTLTNKRTAVMSHRPPVNHLSVLVSGQFSLPNCVRRLWGSAGKTCSWIITRLLY